MFESAKLNRTKITKVVNKYEQHKVVDIVLYQRKIYIRFGKTLSSEKYRIDKNSKNFECM